MAFRPDEIAINEYPRSSFANFKHRLLFDAVDLDYRHYLPESLFGNLPQQAVWGYATLVDEEGQVYVFVRELPPGTTNGLGLFSNHDGKDCRFMPASATSWRGIMLVEDDGSGVTWTSADSVMGEPSLVIRKEADRLHWREKGILELEGVASKPGYQWYDAAPGNQAYASVLHQVAGHVEGKKVTGWVGLDVLYLAPGQVYGYSPMAKGLVLNWAAFANKYDDGSTEWGFIMKGFGNFCAALIIDNDGKVNRSSYVKPEYEQDEAGFPRRMTFEFTDELSGEAQCWHWIPHPQGNLVDIPLMQPEVATYRGAAATLTREGETREVVSSFGWPDFYGDERVQMYRDLQNN